MTRTITPADWGRTETHRLWDWIGSRQQMQHAYFTYSSGRGILGFLECASLLQGKVLDYGCGPGFLTELLAGAGLETHAADYSPKSVAHIEQKMAGRHNWGGARLIENASAPYPNDSFDLVTCIETIEHVPESGLTPLMNEMRRILRPGGVLVITTPNAEDLAENLNYCPFCDTEFHRWQHLRSLSIRDIEQLMLAGNLMPLFAQSLDFSNFQNQVLFPEFRNLDFRSLKDWGNYRIMRRLDKTKPRPFPLGREFKFRLGDGSGPSLCAVAVKSEK